MDPPAQDMSAQLAKIKASGADSVITGNTACMECSHC